MTENFCNQCGKLIPNGTKGQCPYCGNKLLLEEHMNSNFEGTETMPLKKKLLVTLGVVLQIIMPIVAVSSFVAAFAVGGSKGLTLQVIMIGISVFVSFIVCTIAKWRTVSLWVLGIAGAYYLMVLCALTDFPQFLRNIPGPKFLGYIHIYLAIVIAAGIVVMRLLYKMNCKKAIEECKNLLFSDSDLMILFRYKQYVMIGYYIIKGYLHKALVIEKVDEVNYVSVNPYFSEEQLCEYSKNNPQVGRIINFLTSAHRAGFEDKVRLEDIFKYITHNPTIQSEGGKIVSAKLEKFRKINNKIILATAGLCIYPIITKMLMGLLNNKPTGSLAAIALIAILAFLIAFKAAYPDDLWFLTELSKHKLSLSGSLTENIEAALAYENEIPEDKVNKILRSFLFEPISEYDHFMDSNGKTKDDTIYIVTNAVLFQTAVVHATEIARLIAEANARDSSYISSGCSSCSSCGGGCGSCGGCGSD